MEKKNGKFHTDEKRFSIKRAESITRRMTIAFWRISVRLKHPEIAEEHNRRENCFLRVMDSCFETLFLSYTGPDCQLTNV